MLRVLVVLCLLSACASKQYPVNDGQAYIDFQKANYERVNDSLKAEKPNKQP